MLLLRALGIVVLFTGAAAAQTSAAAERPPRGSAREMRTARAVDTARPPAVAARASRAPYRDAAQAADRTRSGGQTPAERASGSLNSDVRADRFRDAARDARGDARPTRPEVQQFDQQRRSLQPDVGRPEQEGRISTEGSAGGLPSLGSNPQR